MKLGFSLFFSCAILLASSAAPAPTALDAEACRDVAAKKSGSLWGHDGCSTTPCGDPSPNCEPDSRYDPATNETTSFCGCEGVEPSCCHTVLVAVGTGLFEPEATGDCSTQDSSCPTGSTCKLTTITGGGKRAKCVSPSIGF